MEKQLLADEKAVLAAEIAGEINARTGNFEDRRTTLNIVAQLLFGGNARITFE